MQKFIKTDGSHESFSETLLLLMMITMTTTTIMIIVIVRAGVETGGVRLILLEMRAKFLKKVNSKWHGPCFVEIFEPVL